MDEPRDRRLVNDQREVDLQRGRGHARGGSIFEFRGVEAGQPFAYLFDTGGDDEPGGEFVADVDFRVADPCEYAIELISSAVT